MADRTYGQFCTIARALDILGDRWTLLLIRELLLGPRRFRDLMLMLPAMGPNRLSGRLAMLVKHQVIRSTTTSGPAATPAYELTELGEQLRKPLLALGLWGLKLPVHERADPASARAELMALCLTGVADRAAAADLHEIIEFQVGTETFHLQISDGEVLARSGASARPDVQAQCEVATFAALALRQITPADALRDGRVKLQRGSRRSFVRVFRILKYRP